MSPLCNFPSLSPLLSSSAVNSHLSCWTRSWAWSLAPITTVWPPLVQYRCCPVAKSCPTLWPHELQHSRLPCPSLSPWVCLNSCPLSQWCHPTTSPSVAPFSSAIKKVKVKSLNRVQLFATPRTVAYQAPPSMGFSRQEHWSGVPFPSPSSAIVLNKIFLIILTNTRLIFPLTWGQSKDE